MPKAVLLVRQNTAWWRGAENEGLSFTLGMGTYSSNDCTIMEGFGYCKTAHFKTVNTVTFMLFIFCCNENDGGRNVTYEGGEKL